LGNQEIADKLFISKATVKTHINHLFRELGVNNRINCLREAKRTGVLVAH
ncbi:MAG: response regulator transcription factor, partial [Pseudomonadales bacterium]|nr:response regulator transcription factor [Pseudomonadales bacterium]